MIRLGLLKYKPVGESLSAFPKSANFLVIDLGAVPIMPEREFRRNTFEDDRETSFKGCTGFNSIFSWLVSI